MNYFELGILIVIVIVFTVLGLFAKTSKYRRHRIRVEAGEHLTTNDEIFAKETFNEALLVIGLIVICLYLIFRFELSAIWFSLVGFWGICLIVTLIEWGFWLPTRNDTSAY